MNIRATADAPDTVIKRGRKYDQVIAGARSVFLEAGFDGAGVDAIAKAAGVSKATLYSYFPDKRLLFMEVATLECRRQTDDALDQADMDGPPREVLTFAGHKILDFLLSPIGSGVFRIVVAEAGRFPEIGREFWACGPDRGREILVDYFTRAESRGELHVPDKRLAADQFSELCKADLFPRLLFGLSVRFPADERARVVDGAVDTFLARFGRPQP